VRQFERLVARKVAEYAIKGVLGINVPRKSRRFMGRIYGNAGWRMMKGVEGTGGYRGFTPHRSVVQYVAQTTREQLYKLMAREQKQQVQPPLLPPMPENQQNAETNT
jgi:hypothetical protein